MTELSQQQMPPEAATAVPRAEQTSRKLAELRVVDSLEALREHSEELSALAEQAVEPNVYYAPNLLFPALECYAGDTRISFLLVYAKPDAGMPEGRRLVGFFPLEHADTFRKLPLQHVRLWRHEHCFLATPLLQGDFVRASFELVTDWAKDQGLKLIEMNLVSADAVILEALNEVLDANDYERHFTHYDRAVLIPKESSDEYLQAVLKRKRRKDFDRQFRQLKKMGDLRWRHHDDVDSLDRVMDEFLALEASGWKGEQGTALKSKQQDARFFRSMVEASQAEGRVLTLSLMLNDEPIAIIVVLTCGRGAYAFKMAYDEEYRSNSPGFHLVMEMIQHVHDSPDIAWMDFCSDPDHAMANRMFCDRKPLFNVDIALQSTIVSKLVQVMPLMKTLKEKFKGDDDD